MVDRFIQWFESKTGIYLHPRFVVFFALIIFSIVIFSTVSFFSRRYTDSVKTIGPTTEEERAEYDARMRTIRPTVPSIPVP